MPETYLYVESTVIPNLRFRVIGYDPATSMARLEGEFGVQFTRNVSKAELEKRGLKRVKSEVELPLSQGDKPPKGDTGESATEE